MFSITVTKEEKLFSVYPVGSALKNLPANARDLGLIPGWGRSPGDVNGNPLQYSCLDNPIQRSLVGYSPWGRKGSDMTEQLNHPEVSPVLHIMN